MQETQVQSLFWEAPACHGATEPSAITIEPCSRAQAEPTCCKCWSPCDLEPVICSTRSHQKEKPAIITRQKPLLTPTREKPEQQQRPSTVINKYLYIFFKSGYQLHRSLGGCQLPYLSGTRENFLDPPLLLPTGASLWRLPPPCVVPVLCPCFLRPQTQKPVGNLY